MHSLVPIRSERYAALALALLTLADSAAVAEPAASRLDVADQAAPVFSVYGTQDGLSDEIWSTVGFDARGFVWAGSASELARFDGYRWMPWPFPAARSLVRDMQDDGHGTLWAIFEREGLARYDGRSWALLGGEQAFHQRFSALTASDGKRETWVGDRHGFLRLGAAGWVADPGTLDDAGTLVSIEQTETLFGEPRQWASGATDGIWYRTLRSGGSAAAWRRFEAPGFEKLPITDLRRSVDRGREELWVLTYGEGLYRISNDGIRSWRATTGELPTEALYSAIATVGSSGERLLWIASRAGLLRIRGDQVVAFDRRHGLPSDAVRGIKLQAGLDGTDLLWLATEGGIARAALSDSQWQTVSLLGARENGAFGVLVEPDEKGGERLWVGSSKQGLGLLEHGSWRYFTRANGALPNEAVRAIRRVTGTDGKPWRLLSLMGGYLLRIHDDLSLQTLATPWPASANESATFILGRQIDGMHELWFATLRSGIYRLRGEQWTHFDAAGAAAPWTVLGLAEQIDRTGRSWLWAASNRGIARFDGTQWQLLGAGQSSDGYRSVTLIADDARSILWAGSNRHGVERLEVTDPLAPTALSDTRVPAPPDPTVYSVLADRAGRIYVCTNNGVQQLTPDAAGGYRERLFRRPDGLVHDECNSNGQMIDEHDRYWVGTLGGLSMFDPQIRTPTASAVAKPLYVTDLRVDGVHHDPQLESALQLPAGARELRIDFNLLSGQREAESSYRSQLIGYDPTPGAWTREHSRAFTGLPPGHYALKVEARDYAGTPASAATLDFSVQSFWWQRPAVRALLALAVLLLAAGLVLLYNRNLRLRQRLLRSQVALRTAELNAANQRLTQLSYLDPLTGVANRRRLIEALDAAIERAATKSLPVGVIVVDVDHFKDYNDRHGHLSGDTALRAVAQALESATREQDLVARFGGEEFACLLVDASIDTVAAIAERMRALVEALPPRTLGNDSQTLTISAGLHSRIPAAGERAADLLAEADAALYQAKRDGRNRVRRADAK